jgi:hypothetical protein
MSESWAQVTRAYQSCDTDELTLPLGVVVKIIRKHDNGWWVGEISGRVGAFPYYCVQEINNPGRPNTPKPQVQPSSPQPQSTTQSAWEHVEAICDYQSSSPLELTLQRGDKIMILNKNPNGWWLGKSERGQGIFPYNFTSPITGSTAQEETFVYVAAFDYIPKSPQELALKSGSVINRFIFPSNRRIGLTICH